MGNSYSLFLRQSYLDAWGDYRRSLHRADFPVWDYIILTASNEAQANAYRQQIAIRRAKNLLPARTHYAVLPDPDGLRVGSGGATLNVLRYVCTQEGTFAGKRILCIHSGGDSKRVPQYSACGKLFSPVPRELPNGRRSTLFDEFIIGMSGVPSRIRDGMLVLSGDVLLLFNPLQIDAPASGAAAISFKEDVETGKNHGVFQMDEQGNVGEFLHKQTVETLTSRGAVNAQGKVDIDTGAVLFSADLLADLYTLVDTPAKFAAFVNDRARLSFYGDFLYPLASRSTLEQFYREKPDGSFTEELHACRTAVWQVLRKYRMRLLRLAPASFIHFGTTHELRTLMTDGVSAYSFLDWKKCVSGCCSSANYALNNAMVEEGCCIHDDCYLEDSHVMGSAIIGSGTVLSHVTISGRNIPANVVLHSLKLTDGRFVTRIYGVADNPKEGTFLGGSMAAFGNVWDGDDHSLWQAKIYPVCDSMAESVDAALNVYALAMGAGDYDAWASAERVSLCSSFNSADTAAILEWETHLRKAVKVERFLSVIRRGGTIEEAKRIFQDAAISAYQRRLIAEKAASADVFTRMRIFYCLGKVLGDSQEGEAYIKRAFEEIQRMVLAGAAAHGTGLCAHHQPVEEEAAVRLPLRVNWGGGWQDQVGGMTPGLKLITAPAGIRQKLNVRHIALSEDTKAELNARFTLIYTGQRRLARNLLRDVVGRYISNTPDSLYALEEIQRIAVMMAFELERGHVDDFAKLLNRHWELSKTIDAGSTNTCIDQIFLAIDDLIDGRMICGAGGGGFLQVLLKRGVTREQLNARLHDTFQDCGVDVWDCTLV